MLGARHAPILAAFALVLGTCVAIALPVRAAAQWPPESFTNLRVLPQDIPVRELVDLMAGFTRALGVRCTYCHIGEESQPLGEYDFASDDRPTKRKARQMLQMVARINDVHLADLESRAEPAVTVRCITCHRGARQPRLLQDVLGRAYETGGIDSTLAVYARLRERYFGGFAYDFGEVPLADVAGDVAARGNVPDAIRLHELNVEMNPASTFARTALVIQALRHAFTTGGAAGGRDAFAAMRERFGAPAFPEPLLNAVGYELLRGGSTDAAVAAFELNVELYPESANVYDSLGEGLAASGDVAGAIRAYERSLGLDPDNANAIAKLRELRGG